MRLANLRSGTLQLIDSVPPQAVASLANDSSVRVAQTPSFGFNAFAFNCTRPPFNDPWIRCALTAAIDPAAIQRVVYFGTGRVSHSPLSPAIAWAFDAAQIGIPFYPARAKSMLTDAGTTAPVPVAITVTNSPQMVRAAW